MTEKEKLGKEILKLREKVSSSDYRKENISQQELADKNLGLTKHFIGTIERGEANPTLDKMILLAKALNIDRFKVFETEIDVNKYIRELDDRF